MIKLVSNSISSSSCPGGDGFSFSPSPKGQYLLAYNSSRIHIIDLRGPTISVDRELKILRRPVATCIQDDGSLLAVLLTEMQVDIYDLTQTPPKHTQSLILDHSPRAIALSPCGSVLAAAYEGGIEVQSLKSSALATDRRSVKCDAVDALAFSFDGTQILGTTVHSAQPNTVILTAPYYDPGAQMDHENISALWTTSILFPNTSRDCSHAVLLQESSHEEASWAFTYDRSFETFRAVRIDDLRNGTSYFTGPLSNTPSKLIPCTLPSASYHGDLVSAGFQGKEVWLYGVPEDLEAVPDAPNNSLEPPNAASGGVYRSVSGSSLRSRPRTREAGERRVPQWQLLCDQYRNTFVGGFKAAELGGVSMTKWVASYGDSSSKERLIVAAKGVTPAKPIGMDDDGMDFEDGGRLTVIDFDYGLEDGVVNEITIEVGMKDPEILEEEHRDLETEVAIVRRRTVAQRRGNRSAIMRAATTTAQPTSAEDIDENDDDDPLVPRQIGAPSSRPRPVSIAVEDTDTRDALEEVEALDAPYSHTGPRSISTIRRAATAAANHRRRNPTTASGAPIEYRRADGRNEHPHESDADNWVPPPPPYQKEDPGEAPAFLRHSIAPVPGVAQANDTNKKLPALPPLPPPPTTSQSHQRVVTRGSPPAQAQARALRRQTYMFHRSENTHSQNSAHHRMSSYPAMPSTQELVDQAQVPRPQHDEDDIYNVSPPDTPRFHGSAPTGSQASEAGNLSQAAAEQGVDPSPTLSTVNATSYTGTQRVIPLVPRLPTAISSDNLHDSGSLSGAPHSVTRHDAAESSGDPHEDGNPYTTTIMQARTWPMPPSSPATHARGDARYPRTTPPGRMPVDDLLQKPYPPVPRTEAMLPPLPATVWQEEETSDHSRSRQSLSRRLSSGFHLPRRHTAQRSETWSAERVRPMSVALQATPLDMIQAGDHDQRPRPGTADGSGRSQARQYYAQPMLVDTHHSHGSRVVGDSQPLPDQPLIISTPTGIHGAYDIVPDHHTDQPVVTPIHAPVPRHARPAERLEDMYQGQLAPGLLVPPAAPSDFPSRVSSLNRRPSRAGRSAAKNIADAKKKGWRPGRSKSKKVKKSKTREPEFDMMSQSAWTDVTYATAGARGERLRHGFDARREKTEKDKKCAVM